MAFGGAVLICVLDRFKEDSLKIFLYGGIVGTVIEYLISFMLEGIYGARFWDYGYMQYNINARISLVYSLFWAMLSLILVKGIKPHIDEFLSKIPEKLEKYIDTAIIVFLIFDTIITVWAINTYQTRILDPEKFKSQKKPEIIKQIEENIFSNNNVHKTFPNLRTRDKFGNEVFLSMLL
jgi:uncharacterized membrane protein